MFKKKEKHIDMSLIRPSSKLSLKMSCLTACNHDIDKAQKLYDYIAADLQDLPDVDPQRPSIIAQVKNSADEIFGWIGQHKDDFIQGYNLLQSMRGNAPALPTSVPADVPPIPKP